MSIIIPQSQYCCSGTSANIQAGSISMAHVPICYKRCNLTPPWEVGYLVSVWTNEEITDLFKKKSPGLLQQKHKEQDSCHVLSDFSQGGPKYSLTPCSNTYPFICKISRGLYTVCLRMWLDPFIGGISMQLPACVMYIYMFVCPSDRYLKKKELEESLILHPSPFMQNLMKHGVVSIPLIR